MSIYQAEGTGNRTNGVAGNNVGLALVGSEQRAENQSAGSRGIEVLFETLEAVQEIKRIVAVEYDAMDTEVADSIWRRADKIAVLIDEFIDAGEAADQDMGLEG